MNKKILDILEFDKVKQLFEPYLQTEQGEMELAALTPTDKKENIGKRILINDFSRDGGVEGNHTLCKKNSSIS